MFARITKYKMKPGSRDEAVAKLEALKDQIMSMPGVVNFINCTNEDGSGCSISVNESQELAEANAAQVQAVWSQFADFLEAAPQPEGYDVVVNWGG